MKTEILLTWSPFKIREFTGYRNSVSSLTNGYLLQSSDSSMSCPRLMLLSIFWIDLQLTPNLCSSLFNTSFIMRSLP